MTDAIDLKADCTRCAALCCMAPAFDKSLSFGIDKPAQTPCPNLDEAGACVIHEKLTERGFSGCVAYQCFGAGQRVTQDIFAGRSWLAEPQLKASMTRAFMALRQIHELLAMLAEAGKLPLDAAERRTLTELAGAMQPAGGWSEETLASAPLEEMAAQTHQFLQSLRRHVSAR